MGGGFDLLSGSEPPFRINGGNDASNEDTRAQVIYLGKLIATWSWREGVEKRPVGCFQSASEGGNQNMPKRGLRGPLSAFQGVEVLLSV